MYVCHSCDNPRCVNPKHLFAGSAMDNAADMVAKGRNQRGEKKSNAKLTQAQAAEIKAAIGPQRVIAEKFGVSQPHVSLIKSGHHWRHLDANE